MQRVISKAKKIQMKTLKLIIITFLLTFFYSTGIFAQEDITFEQALVELEGTKDSLFFISNRIIGPEKWERHAEAIKKYATSKQLDSLAFSSKSPSVRLIAFYALYNKQYDMSVDLCFKMLRDSDIIFTRQEYPRPELHPQTIRRRILDLLNFNLETYSTTLSKDSLDIIDSTFIYHEAANGVSGFDGIMNRCKGVPKYYDQFQKLFGNGRYEMIKYIAAYKNRQDIDKIIAALEDYTKYHYDSKKDTKYSYAGLDAIKEFPDEVFVPYLEKLSKKVFNAKIFPWHQRRNYFAAVMAYDNEWAYQLIEQLFEENKKSEKAVLDITRGYVVSDKQERFKPLIEKYSNEEIINKAQIYGSEHLYIKRPWYMFWKRKIAIPK